MFYANWNRTHTRLMIAVTKLHIIRLNKNDHSQRFHNLQTHMHFSKAALEKIDESLRHDFVTTYGESSLFSLVLGDDATPVVFISLAQLFYTYIRTFIHTFSYKFLHAIATPSKLLYVGITLLPKNLFFFFNSLLVQLDYTCLFYTIAPLGLQPRNCSKSIVKNRVNK